MEKPNAGPWNRFTMSCLKEMAELHLLPSGQTPAVVAICAEYLGAAQLRVPCPTSTSATTRASRVLETLPR